MKSCVRFLCSVAFLVALFFASFTNLAAQQRQVKVSQGERGFADSFAAPKKEPFKVGETLTYEAKYSRLLLRGIDVADLTFTVADDEKDSPNELQFKAEAVSKGSLLKLVSYSFLQKFDSTVQTDNFRILQTVRYDEQDKRVRNSEANFDYLASKLTYREIDPNNLMSPPRMITSPLETSAQDLISALYYLRRQPLTVGKEFMVRLSDSGVVYDIPVKVVARELQKSVLGKMWTLRIEPQIFGEKRPLAGEGKMIMWVTDDIRHIPVRSQIQANIGKIEIKLRRAENLQSLKQ
ncbi:MAG: DUF3108 domain-containing protein [Pyrinomonadaceae bacterium]